MYTKIFLFVLILNIIPQKASNGNTHLELNIHNQNALTISDVSSSHHNSANEKSGASTSDWSDIGQHAPDHHNGDDDGKAHHIHFDRYLRHKNRNLYCIACKIILLFSYLCSLLTACYHLCH